MSIVWVLVVVLAGWPVASLVLGLALGRALAACAASPAGLSPAAQPLGAEIERLHPYLIYPGPATGRDLAG
jgi:hypothetical protein